MLGFAVPFTSLSKLCKNAGPKLFCWAKLACLDFSSSNFNLQGHIMNTSGVALSMSKCSINGLTQLICRSPHLILTVYQCLQSVTLLNQWRWLKGLERPWCQWIQRLGAPVLLWRTGICSCFHGALILSHRFLWHLWQHPAYLTPLKELAMCVHHMYFKRVPMLLTLCIWRVPIAWQPHLKWRLWVQVENWKQVQLDDHWELIKLSSHFSSNLWYGGTQVRHSFNI